MTFKSVVLLKIVGNSILLTLFVRREQAASKSDEQVSKTRVRLAKKGLLIQAITFLVVTAFAGAAGSHSAMSQQQAL